MTCSFQKLVRLLDNELDVDDKLEVLNHVDACEICRDAVYQIVRDRDEKLFVRAAYAASQALDAEWARARWF